MILLITKGAKLDLYDNNRKRPTDYICEWSEEAVKKLNLATDGKYRFKEATSLHENSDIDQQSNNNSSVGNIAELINVGRTQMAGGNKFSMSGHVSCAHGNNLQPKQGKGIAYRDENGNLKTFAEVLSSFRKAYLR